MKNHQLIQELIKANDHIAFLSRLTNNKIKVFGQEFDKRSQDDMLMDQNSVYGSKELLNVTHASKFQYPADDDNQTNFRSPDRKDGNNQAREESGFLDQLSNDFKNASEEERKLPEV